MTNYNNMELGALLEARRDLVAKRKAGKNVAKHLRDVGRAIRDSRAAGNRIRRKAVPTPIVPEVKGKGADEQLLDLEATLLSASRIIRALTGNALAAAKQRGASPTELEALKGANDNADACVRVARREVQEVKDRKARNEVEVPNHNAPLDSAPPIHAVHSDESCPKCEKHKYPSCGLTVFASLRKANIDPTLTWLEKLNGKPLKRDAKHTAMVTDDLIERACAEVGFETELTVFDTPPRFGDMLSAVLHNNDSATYIVHVPKHVLLLRTKGGGKPTFELLDSGFMFKREGCIYDDPAQVKTRRKVRKLLRVWSD